MYACPVPVVSAVGHDIDVSICDFVADVRAPTPSAAAELATPDRAEVVDGVEQVAARLAGAVDSRWRSAERAFRSAVRRSIVREPRRLVEIYEQRLDLYASRLMGTPRVVFDPRVARFRHLDDLLRLSNPRRPLERGYSITYRVGRTSPIRSASEVEPGSELETVLAKGRIVSRVERRSE